MENEPQKTEVNIEKRNELEMNVIEYITHKYDGFTEEGWIEKYGKAFAELYENSDIADRYEAHYDDNPEELYEWIQSSVETMSRKEN